MKSKKFLRLAFVSLLAALAATPAWSQDSFQLSSKFYVADFVRGRSWDGQHSFANVFCLTFPKSLEANSIAWAMYNNNNNNNNAIYYSRAMYGNTTGLFVVMSTVLAGRSVETEIGNMEARNKQSAEASPDYFKQASRSMLKHPDGKLRMVSVHRLFVRGSDRGWP